MLIRMEIRNQASDNRIRNHRSRRFSKRRMEIITETTTIIILITALEIAATATRTTTAGTITKTVGIRRITMTIHTLRIDVVARIRTRPNIRITDSIQDDSIEKTKNIRNSNHRIRIRYPRRVQAVIIIMLQLQTRSPHHLRLCRSSHDRTTTTTTTTTIITTTKDAPGNPRIPTITTTSNRIEEIVEATTPTEVISTIQIDNPVIEEGISNSSITTTHRIARISIRIIGIAAIITIDILDRDHP